MNTGRVSRVLWKIGHGVGYYKNSVEGPLRHGVTRRGFGLGEIVEVWGGGLPPETTHPQLLALINPSTTDSLKSRILDGFANGQISLNPEDYTEARGIFTDCKAKPELAASAEAALKTLPAVPADAAAEALGNLGPTHATRLPSISDLNDSDCPLETLLKVRATGQVQEEQLAGAGQVKFMVKAMLEERIERGVLTREQIDAMLKNPDSNIQEGARKTIEDFFPAAVATPPVYQAVPPPSVDAGPTEITQPGMRIVHLPSAPAEAGEPTVITAPMSEAELIAGLFQGFEARVDEMRQQAIQLLASLKRHRANLADEDAPEVTEALRKTIAAQEAKLDGQRAAMQALAEELGAKVAAVQAQADALMAPLKALFGTKKEG